MDEEQKAIAELMAMPPAELEKVPFEIARWQCKIKFCKCFTRVRDYGIFPIFWHKRGVIDNDTKELFHWINSRNRFFICAKHNKHFKGRRVEDLPLKKANGGGILWGWDETGKELIIW